MTEKRDILPLTLDQLKLVVAALNTHYYVNLKETMEKEDETELARTEETTKELAHIQETLQFVTLIYNLRTKQINEEVARAGGLIIEEDGKEISYNIGESPRK